MDFKTYLSVFLKTFMNIEQMNIDAVHIVIIGFIFPVISHGRQLLGTQFLMSV